MRINDGFRLILSAIAIGIEEIGFAQQAQEAKEVWTPTPISRVGHVLSSV